MQVYLKVQFKRRMQPGNTNTVSFHTLRRQFFKYEKNTVFHFFGSKRSFFLTAMQLPIALNKKKKKN